MFRIFLLLVALVLSFSSGAFDKGFTQSWSAYPWQRGLQPRSGSDLLLQKIMEEYAVWKGTPYLWGGDSQFGIDCSAFSRRIIYETLHRRLPRTTLGQSQIGLVVGESQLDIGDLVFFMIKPNVRHVGVYVGKDRFIHASSSQGVMVSTLSDTYWQAHFLMARRVIA